MLAIRMQRTGRSGHAQFRVIVQDSRFHPTRGKVVAYLGSYNPHTKSANLDKDLASKYLNNGAQPSDRVAGLLKAEGIKLPDWANLSEAKKSSIKNPEKLRRNRPQEEKAVEASEQPTEEATVAEETSAPETPSEESAETTAPETSEPVEVPAEATSEVPTEQPAEEAETTPEV